MIRSRSPGPRIRQLHRKAHVQIAAELDVGAAARHVGGDRYGAGTTGLGDDLGFLLVVAGIQDRVRDLLLLQKLGQDFRLLDRHGADQDRLVALARAFLDQGRDGLVLLAAWSGRPRRRSPCAGPGRWSASRPLRAVDLGELAGLGHGGAGHAGETRVQAEVVLEGDRGERLVLALDGDVFLGLQGLMEAFGIAAPFHHAAGELIDDDDLVVLDDVVLVALEQGMGAQRLVDVVDQTDVLDVVEGALGQEAHVAQDLLDLLGAGSRSC